MSEVAFIVMLCFGILTLLCWFCSNIGFVMHNVLDFMDWCYDHSTHVCAILFFISILVWRTLDIIERVK